MCPYNEILRSIDNLYSDCSQLDKVTKLAYLRGQWNRLNQLASQYSLYLQGRLRITQEERQSAHKLVEMIQCVETEGVTVENDIRNDFMNGLLKVLLG